MKSENKFSEQHKETTQENRVDIDEIIKSMSLEEKVGQLFIVHAYGQTPTDTDYEDTNLENNRGGKNFKEIIEKYHVGGVIYFNWSDNIGMPLDAKQVHSLSNGLQDIAMDQDQSIPLFISTDQEGGIVQRVTSPATVFPGNMALGATRSETYAAMTADILGGELTSLGINMNFAPSLDVNMNPDNPVIGVRSFGEDPDLVSRLGMAQINAFKEQNMIASAKHFPGHGDTDTDSHSGLPIINHDLETLHEVDLKPFQHAIDSAIDSVMSAHIEVPELDDSGMPATLSKPIFTDLLRGEMGFDGLTVTDSLGMSGANVVDPERVSVEAFKAGTDILLNPPDVELAYSSMLDAVHDGEISEGSLDDSVCRILKEKRNKGLFDQPKTDSDAIKDIGTADNLQAAEEMANRSMTLLKNEGNVLPLDSETSVLVTGPSEAKPDDLTLLLHDKGLNAISFATAMNPDEDEISEAVNKAEQVDMIIATTFTANTNDDQQKLVKRLLETDKPVINTAIRNPYDVMAFPEVDASLVTYGDRDVSIKALSKALVGDINPSGKLPVTLPDLYDYGHGLDYINTPLSSEGMQKLLDNLDEAGGFSDDQIVHALKCHLKAVAHYEKTDAKDKVIKHMKTLKKLLSHQKYHNAISDKIYNYLDTEADKLIEMK